jgi:hypothetical protein
MVGNDYGESGFTRLRPTTASRGRRGGRAPRDERDASSDFREREFDGTGNRGGRGRAKSVRPAKKEKLTDNTELFPELQ